MVFRTESIACAGLFQADASSDVACEEFIAVFSLVCVHFEEAGDPLSLSFVVLMRVVPFVQRSAIDADEGQPADIRVGHDFEGKRSKRTVISRSDFNHLVSIEFMPFDHTAIERRWHPADNCIEKRLDPFVFEGCSAEDRIDLVGDDPFADGSMDLIFCEWYRDSREPSS